MRRVRKFALNVAITFLGCVAILYASHMAWADVVALEVVALHHIKDSGLEVSTGVAIFFATLFAIPTGRHGWTAYVSYKWSRMRDYVLRTRYPHRFNGDADRSLRMIARGHLLAYLRGNEFMMDRLKRRFNIVAGIYRARGISVPTLDCTLMQIADHTST